jgi:hypothetical protein
MAKAHIAEEGPEKVNNECVALQTVVQVFAGCYIVKECLFGCNVPMNCATKPAGLCSSTSIKNNGQHCTAGFVAERTSASYRARSRTSSYFGG